MSRQQIADSRQQTDKQTDSSPRTVLTGEVSCRPQSASLLWLVLKAFWMMLILICKVTLHTILDVFI